MSNTALVILALIQHGPEMARGILALFQKESPSQADWEALFATYRRSYESYVMPPTPPAEPNP